MTINKQVRDHVIGSWGLHGVGAQLKLAVPSLTWTGSDIICWQSAHKVISFLHRGEDDRHVRLRGAGPRCKESEVQVSYVVKSAEFWVCLIRLSDKSHSREHKHSTEEPFWLKPFRFQIRIDDFVRRVSFFGFLSFGQQFDIPSSCIRCEHFRRQGAQRTWESLRSATLTDTAVQQRLGEDNLKKGTQQNTERIICELTR